MRAKLFIFSLAVASLAMLATGCSNSRRFLPGGVVKVRDLAKGRPINPEVADEIIATEAAARSGEYPDLSAQPDTPPPSMPAGESRAATDALLSAKAELERRIAEDRAAAAAERTESLVSPDNP